MILRLSEALGRLVITKIIEQRVKHWDFWVALKDMFIMNKKTLRNLFFALIKPICIFPVYFYHLKIMCLIKEKYWIYLEKLPCFECCSSTVHAAYQMLKVCT